jgi:molybdopterin converting factor small subunit
MTVLVQFYAQLRDLAGTAESKIDVKPDATVTDLLEEVYRQMPALRSQDKGIVVGAGLTFVNRDHVIKQNETISIMPPVQGG